LPASPALESQLDIAVGAWCMTAAADSRVKLLAPWLVPVIALYTWLYWVCITVICRAWVSVFKHVSAVVAAAVCLTVVIGHNVQLL